MQYLGFANLTPFAAQPLLLSDERGSDVFTCVVKGTFTTTQTRQGTSVALADEQAAVCVAPVYNGEPGLSSIKYESETALVKPGTDVALIGHAYAPRAGTTCVDVSLSVGPARLSVRVFGNRVWTNILGRWTTSAPEPFEAIPLVYERAFGGWDRSSANAAHHDYEPRNPVGVGLVSRKYAAVREGAPLPNLENPSDLIGSPTDRPAPTGFGFIGPDWQPRARYAGTHDARWEKQRMPLLPDDFDRRFYSAAPPSMAFGGYLRGGEAVEVVNASPHGTLRFLLPAAQPFATVRMKDGATHRIGMALDTVIVNTDEGRLFLLWRGSVAIHKRVHDMLWTKVQLAPDGGAGR